VVTFHVTPLGDAEQLFAVLPSISPDGDLAFMTHTNANGEASFRLSASDDDGASSPPVVFRIRVEAVNDAPSFRVAAAHQGRDLGQDIDNQIFTVREDEFSTARFSLPAFARDISAGPSDEAGQRLSFRVSFDHQFDHQNGGGLHGRALFAEQPAVDAGGALTFRPKP